jgi:hypothetical protein
VRNISIPTPLKTIPIANRDSSKPPPQKIPNKDSSNESPPAIVYYDDEPKNESPPSIVYYDDDPKLKPPLKEEDEEEEAIDYGFTDDELDNDDEGDDSPQVIK